jgi:hypothetical protein
MPAQDVSKKTVATMTAQRMRSLAPEILWGLCIIVSLIFM